MLRLDDDVLSKMSIKKEDLDVSFKEALKNKDFKKMVEELEIPTNDLKNYTSILEECSIEYGHCLGCKSIMECKNKVRGYAYLPCNIDGRLEFGYTACKYLKEVNSLNKFSKNVTLIGASAYLKDAKMKDIYTSDKNRFECIKWLKNFIDNYPNVRKGLYLCGNFGCGKSYLIASCFNELAKKDVKSVIVFWPYFLTELKSLFGDSEYNYKINLVKNTPLLLIDDIGAENLSDWGRDEILCPILNARMESGLPTFFTSNLDLDLLEQHLSVSKSGVDKLKAKRIMERIYQVSDNLKIVGENYRR